MKRTFSAPVAIGVVALLLLVAGCARREEAEPPANQPSRAAGPKVLMVIAHQQFRDEELLVPKGILRENGFVVVVASTSLEPAKGMAGGKVKPDILLKDADAGQLAAVIFVGGVGAQDCYDNPDALRLAGDAAAQGKVVGAICLATGILASADVLKGKTVTGWPSDEHRRRIAAAGATFVEKDVVTDGKFVTASGPNAVTQFGKALVEALKR